MLEVNVNQKVIHALIGILSLGLLFSVVPQAKPEEAQAKQILDECGSVPSCFDSKLESMSRDFPFETVHATLLELEQMSPTVRSCHTLAHIIASEELKKDPGGWKDFLQKIDPQECGGGFFHGVLEARESSDPSFKATHEELNEFCLDQKNDYSIGSCSHIFGHLMLIYTKDDVSKALASCDGAQSNLVLECYGGVFMEHAVRTELAEHGLGSVVAWNDSYERQFKDLCSRYQGLKADACWGQLGYIISSVNNDNPQRVFSKCQESGDETWTDNCYQHAESKIVLTSGNKEYVSEVCDPYRNDNRKYQHCAVIAASSMMTTSQANHDKAYSFCDGLEGFARSSCNQEVTGLTK